MTGSQAKPWSCIVGLLLLACAAGCTHRSLVWPTHMQSEVQEHIYFVEQEMDKDSRIKKCDIFEDNSVKCTVQFDLD